MAFYSLAGSFEGFALAEITFGVGIAFLSGSLNALVYDSLLSEGREAEMKNVVSTKMTFSFLVASVGTITGGFLGEWNLRAPFVISSVVLISCTVIAWFFYEESPTKRAKNSGDAIRTAMGSFSNPILVALVLFSISAAVSGRIAFWSYQPILLSNGLSPVNIGIIFATFNIIAILGTNATRRITASTRKVLLVLLVLDTMTIAILAMVNKMELILILGVLYTRQFARGAQIPIFTQAMQDELLSKERATFVSMNSFLSSLLYFIMSLYLDTMHSSLEESLWFSVGINIILLGLYLLVANPRMRTKVGSWIQHLRRAVPTFNFD